MHIDKRKSKNNVTVSVIDTRSVVKIMSGILVFVLIATFSSVFNNFTDKDKLTELKQMLDEVRSYKVNINQDFYYKLSEAFDMIKNKDQVPERVESDVEYENNFVENQNYEDADDSDDQSMSYLN